MRLKKSRIHIYNHIRRLINLRETLTFANFTVVKASDLNLKLVARKKLVSVGVEVFVKSQQKMKRLNEMKRVFFPTRRAVIISYFGHVVSTFWNQFPPQISHLITQRQTSLVLVLSFCSDLIR